MKSEKFSLQQINIILKEFYAGKSAAEVGCEYGISQGTFYQWCQHFGGMEVSELHKLKKLEKENHRLRHRYAELTLRLSGAFARDPTY